MLIVKTNIVEAVDYSHKIKTHRKIDRINKTQKVNSKTILRYRVNQQVKTLYYLKQEQREEA